MNHLVVHLEHYKSTILTYIYIHIHTYRKWLSRVWLFATPWATCSSDHGIFQPRVLEWVAISFSRVFSWPRDRIRVSCNCRQRFYHLSQQGSPYIKVGTRLEFNFLSLLNKFVSLEFFFDNILCEFLCLSFQFSCSVMSDSATPWIAARQASLSITNSRSSTKLMSIE